MGVYLNNTFGSYVSNNRIFAFIGVEAYKGSHNTIVNNIIDLTDEEIYVFRNIVINNSSGNIVFGNKLWAYSSSVDLIQGSCHNYIYDNKMWAWALTLDFSYSNKNYVTGNDIGVWTSGIYLIHSCNNTFYHNSFIETLEGLSLYIDGYSLNNTWDNGYPSGGNYWSDYAGVDCYSGPYQNETSSDRIGDTPYIIDMNNRDRYPLMHPWFEFPKIDYEPYTLNLWVEDGWFTSHIELPIGYEVSQVNASTILLNETVPIDLKGNVTVGDYDKDGVPDLTVQFNRTEVIRYIRDVQKIRYGSVKLTVAGELFDGTSFEGTGTIKVRMAGDINCDGVIDLYDLTAWANAFGSQPGYPNWNPLADLNQDEIVDIFDAVIIAINYGKTWG